MYEYQLYYIEFQIKIFATKFICMSLYSITTIDAWILQYATDLPDSSQLTLLCDVSDSLNSWIQGGCLNMAYQFWMLK